MCSRRYSDCPQRDIDFFINLMPGATPVSRTPKDKVPNLEDHVVLEDFEDVFKEVLGLPPKRY
jgi:hypothetical protein